jgi:hypothetical protein
MYVVVNIAYALVSTSWAKISVLIYCNNESYYVIMRNVRIYSYMQLKCVQMYTTDLFLLEFWSDTRVVLLLLQWSFNHCFQSQILQPRTGLETIFLTNNSRFLLLAGGKYGAR